MKEFKTFLKDEKGQMDILGNLLEIIKTYPFILITIFLAIIYTTTFTFNIGGIELSLGESVLTPLLLSVSNAFGFSFDWRLFVIICFLAVAVGFIFKYGHNAR